MQRAWSWVFTRLSSKLGHFSQVIMGRMRVITLVKHSGDNKANLNFISLVKNVDVFVRGASNSSCFVGLTVFISLCLHFFMSSFLQSSVFLSVRFLQSFHHFSLHFFLLNFKKQNNTSKQLLSNVPSTIFYPWLKGPPHPPQQLAMRFKYALHALQTCYLLL